MSDMHEANRIIAAERGAGRSSLTEPGGKRLLWTCGVRSPRSTVVGNPEEARSALGGLQAPFVVKVVSPEILHKSDVGGVALDLPDAGAVATAIEVMAKRPEIRDARVDGYLVEEMLPQGREMVVGATRDPSFGMLLMVGLGGIFVEVLKDVAFRICPISTSDAWDMLRELRGAALLDGVRGVPPADKQAIIDVLMRIGGPDGLLANLAGEIEELDINPLIVSTSGAVAADARIILSTAPESNVLPQVPDGSSDVLERFAPLFEPKTVAVIGASSTSVTMANTFIRRIKAFSYPGKIYPIHPSAKEIEDVPAYPKLCETPEPIDYAYIAISAKRVPGLLAEADGQVKYAQVLSSGFGETEDGKALERDLLAAAREGGCRLIGPNCLGMYSPRGRITFPINPPEEVGRVGIVSQSGGLGTDIIKRGQSRGVRFSGVVTVGNSVDIGPVDLLEYYLADEQTKVVGLYLEGVRDGRRLFDLLRSTQAPKPVVILKGGRSEQGHTAAASHTGALAGNQRAWQALASQTTVSLVRTVDEFIDALLAFQNIRLRPERPTRRVVLFGNGGGTGVLATDYFAELGLDVTPFESPAREALEALNLPPGTSVANPIDTPVATLQEENGWIAGKILERVNAYSTPDAIVMHLNLASFVGRGEIDPIDNLIRVAEQVQSSQIETTHFFLVLRSDGSADLDDVRRRYRERALAVGIPVFDELTNAAQALSVVQSMERRFSDPGGI